jgi:DNA-binding MarR family transcriptional regulator/RimJ/RimL family protein N-acetyltransferase
MESTAILRRFNRSYTQRIGALDESFLGLGLPLGSARLLFEIGAEEAPTVQRLRVRLDLDSGYLSRLLRSLEEQGLVTVEPDPDDRRRRLVRLTALGRRTRQKLDDRSEELAARLVEPLSPRQRERLGEALATADLLVRAATVHLESVDPTEPDAQTALASYFAEVDRRFEGGFDPGPGDDPGLYRPPHGTFLMARSDGDPVACGGVRPLAEGVAEIKRMWVHDDWRGAGLGARLLRCLEDAARQAGYRMVRLDTNSTLVEAIAMYERAGYRSIGRYGDNPYAERWFEKELRS